MKRSRVRPSIRPYFRLSVRLYIPSIDSSSSSGGFADGRLAGKQCRSIAGDGAQQQQRRSTALSSKCGQCRVDSRGRG